MINEWYRKRMAAGRRLLLYLTAQYEGDSCLPKQSSRHDKRNALVDEWQM